MSRFRSPGTSWGHGPHCFSKANQSPLERIRPGWAWKASSGAPGAGEAGRAPEVRDLHWQQHGAGQLIHTQSTQGLHRCPQSPGEDLGGGDGQRGRSQQDKQLLRGKMGFGDRMLNGPHCPPIYRDGSWAFLE